ncbi:MAG TPA: hypothetical protein VGP19_02345 [Candidatus Acidoferrales bacterium]|nr:hypothetical protein [Candidatus Acidoferrales bacterium]
MLYWEQAEASAHASNATISHLREHIRTLSSRTILPGLQADNNRVRALHSAAKVFWRVGDLEPGPTIAKSIRMLRKSAMIEHPAGSSLRIIPAETKRSA